MSDLMSIFNISKRGLATQQKAIGVTSHNISNANTEGYSRQRAVIETTRPFGMPSINSTIGPGQVGTGSTVKTINRIRDEFLDFQVRNETSTLGTYEARDKFLSEIESIFNEPSDSGLSTLVGKFFDSWQQLSKQPQSSNARTVVANQAAALANELNHTYNQMQKLKTNTQTVIKDTVFETNNILNQLDQLNQQIMGVKVSGQEPNDLMDKRDLLVEKLSKIMDIDINKREFYSVDISPDSLSNLPVSGEGLIIRKEPNYSVSRFSYINGIKKSEPDAEGKCTIEISYLKNGNASSPGDTITITNIDKSEVDQLYRHIDECRVIWAREDGTSYADDVNIDYSQSKDKIDKELGLLKPQKGELNGYMTVQEDVDKYVDRINKLAKSVAFSVNAVHSGVYDDYSNLSDPISAPSGGKLDTDGDGNIDNKIDFIPFFVNNSEAKYGDDAKLSNIGDVLSNEAGINAGNISINKEILHDVMKIKTRTHDDEFAHESDNNIDGETDGNRALAIAQLRDKLFMIQHIDDNTTRKSFIEELTGDGTNGALEDDGSGVKTIKSNINGMKVDNYFKDIIDELGIQEQEAQRIVINQETLLSGFQTSRESVSGVSLDEEMSNLIQYQHAYQANAKIVSVVDQLLDVVINGLVR